MINNFFKIIIKKLLKNNNNNKYIQQKKYIKNYYLTVCNYNFFVLIFIKHFSSLFFYTTVKLLL